MLAINARYGAIKSLTVRTGTWFFRVLSHDGGGGSVSATVTAFAPPVKNGLAYPRNMAKSLIAVGSKRGPKLDAMHEALDTFARFLAPEVQFEVIGFEVESGVGHTPLSSPESMRGARHRAESLVHMAAAKRESYLYYVGLEGGLEVMEGSHPKTAASSPSANPTFERRVFLESWAYVTDGSRGYFGRSGAVELPEALAVEVVGNHAELADAIDRFAGQNGVRDSGGAWGILSGGLISRREAFRIALIAAFAPFYNPGCYPVATAAP